ncbi:MAG: molybdopterin-guanine dinucleotide biosynthesis protein B [Rhizobiales bacterium]|nr:molybdopterin-guanine dinucleotide biosynthesis protein B [Hyphomicrobiales bacterium]
MTNQRVFGVTGWKNSGKTTLVCELVAEITRRGFSVSTVKHAHKTFEMDHEGRDSYRHRASGATEVAVSSKMRWAVLHELRGAEEPALPEMLARLCPVDLVLIEGFKREAHPKIECRRTEARSQEPIVSLGGSADDTGIVAIARDFPVETDLPDFDINDIKGIADFILDHVGLTEMRQSARSS